VPRLLPIVVVAFVLLPSAGALAATSEDLPRAHPVDVTAAGGSDGPIDAGARPRVPDYLKPSGAHAADHWTGTPGIKEEQYQDQHGHVLTFATDNASVDLGPYANLLASTYHGDEIELVHVFVTSASTLAEICGGDAAACYGADAPGETRGGVMIIAYEDAGADITHAVIHEYGHHIDNQTYNLGRSECGINGDGSRRWFFAREVDDQITETLTCDPRADWGRLLAEVYAEDYSQMAGIPRSEYHPAIVVDPPTTNEKNKLRQDLDQPFFPLTRKAKGRSSRNRTATFRLTTGLPVFLSVSKRKGVRSVSFRGCFLPGFRDVFTGTCRVVVKTKRARARFSFNVRVS